MEESPSRLHSIVSFFKNRWKLLLLVVIIAAGLGWWWYQQAIANQPDVTFENPKRETLTKSLEVSGVVDADEKARLRYLTGGKLTYLGAEEGSFVEKGKTIAVIDQATLKKQLEQDLNNFMKERLDWDQTNVDVYEDVYTTDEERIREKGQLDLTNEVLDVEIRDIAIQNTRLTAPFAGIVTHSPTATTGVQLLSTDYFELINPETLIFRAEVDEADIALVTPNLQAKIELDAYPDKIIETYVNYVSFTSSETSSGTVFLVEMPLNATQYGLDFFRIGMNGDVAIELETKPNVLTIPLIALKERDGKTYVDIKTSDDPNDINFEEKEISLGLETDEKVEVVSGLTEQDQIVVPE